MIPTPSSPVIASVDRNETIPRRTAISLKIRLTLIDGSQLYVAENYVRLTGWIDYAYQWQTATHQLIHRWDNAHPVDLPTSPYHRNAGPPACWFRRKPSALRANDVGENPYIYRQPYYFRLKYSASGPKASAGKNDSAVRITITAKSSARRSVCRRAAFPTIRV